MYATDYFETMILNLARGISATAPQTMYLALYLNDPSDSGGGTEVSYSGYARQPITFSAPAPSGGGMAIQNDTAITFAEATVDVGNATHVGVLDSLTGGNMYVYGPLSEVLNIQANVSPVVRANAIKWISSGKIVGAGPKKVHMVRSPSGEIKTVQLPDIPDVFTKYGATPAFLKASS